MAEASALEAERPNEDQDDRLDRKILQILRAPWSPVVAKVASNVVAPFGLFEACR